MAFKRTTVTVHPNRAERLRELRDQRDLDSMDAALRELLDSHPTEDTH